MPRLINCVDMGSYMLLNDSRPDVCCQVVVVTLQCISTCVHGLLQRRRESSWAGRPLPAVAVFIAVSVAKRHDSSRGRGVRKLPPVAVDDAVYVRWIRVVLVLRSGMIGDLFVNLARFGDFKVNNPAQYFTTIRCASGLVLVVR